MEDLEFPRFDAGDLSDELMKVAAIVSLAGLMDHTTGLLMVLKEHAIEWTLHVNRDGNYCLHLPCIFGEHEGLVHDNLAHLLVAGCAHTLKFKQDAQTSARYN